MKSFNDFNNAQVRQLPEHLKKYIVDQEYEHYTFADHALWRYVMRQNYSYLREAAYYPYIPGLKKAGLTIEKIPSLQEINDALANIGWGAVTVDGFIPPAAFMEYQAWRVLVIAADIRTLKHIEYTPAPDIIHESAGHAPIISDVHYNRFLSHLGSVGTKAMFSKQDHELYEAIRSLSILKETPSATEKEIKQAEDQLRYRQANMGEPSEMALLSRLQWWTVEYGLIGRLESPKIYGAGLLSSIGESVSCMRPEVKKIPYTIEAIQYAYDITKPQPQLFVTPTFENLLDVLHEFESTMAYKKGGAEGLKKAVASEQICTAVLNSGLQITGKFNAFRTDPEFGVSWISTIGPIALCRNDRMIEKSGSEDLPEGCIIVIGKLTNTRKPIDELSPAALRELGVQIAALCDLQFENGIKVSGRITALNFHNEKIEQIHLTEALVLTSEGRILHDAEDGILHLIVGSGVQSVFCGSADKRLFNDGLHLSGQKTRRIEYAEKDKRYHKIFKEIRELREGQPNEGHLEKLLVHLETEFPDDWLATLEIAELAEARATTSELYAHARGILESKKVSHPQNDKLISDGLSIIDRKMKFE